VPNSGSRFELLRGQNFGEGYKSNTAPFRLPASSLLQGDMAQGIAILGFAP
jgi:hypothetical protein